MITAMNEAVDLQSMDEGTRPLVLGLPWQRVGQDGVITVI